MGRVFAIKKYAIHDGPNIRTTVFLKGCPLRCWWCHNPEGIETELSTIWIKNKCIGCKKCLHVCPTLSLSQIDGEIRRDSTTCRQCRSCVEICPALAHEAIGWESSVADIISIIEKDIPFYDESKGGVTISGGEPLMQPGFLLDILRECGKLGINRAVDTTVYAEKKTVLQVAENCDMFLIDLKHMNSDKHRLYTGVPNELILSNIRALSKKGKQIRIRIPLIAGVNSDKENMHASAAFLAGLPHPPEVDLLPYHTIAESKYRKMNRTYPAVAFQQISKKTVRACSNILARMGLTVQIGG